MGIYDRTWYEIIAIIIADGKHSYELDYALPKTP